MADKDRGKSDGKDKDKKEKDKKEKDKEKKHKDKAASPRGDVSPRRDHDGKGKKLDDSRKHAHDDGHHADRKDKERKEKDRSPPKRDRDDKRTDAKDDRRDPVSPRRADLKKSPEPARKDAKDRSPPRSRDKDRSPVRKDKDRSPARRDGDRSPVRREKDRSPVRKDKERSPVRRDKERSPVRGRDDRESRSERDTKRVSVAREGSGGVREARDEKRISTASRSERDSRAESKSPRDAGRGERDRLDRDRDTKSERDDRRTSKYGTVSGSSHLAKDRNSVAPLHGTVSRSAGTTLASPTADDKKKFRASMQIPNEASRSSSSSSAAGSGKRMSIMPGEKDQKSRSGKNLSLFRLEEKKPAKMDDRPAPTRPSPRRDRFEREEKERKDRERKEKEDRERDRERKEREERDRLERDRKARRERDEREKADRERKEREEKERKEREERERKEREEKERLEAERKKREEQEKREREERELKLREAQEDFERAEKRAREDRDIEEKRMIERARRRSQMPSKSGDTITPSTSSTSLSSLAASPTPTPMPASSPAVPPKPTPTLKVPIATSGSDSRSGSAINSNRPVTATRAADAKPAAHAPSAESSRMPKSPRGTKPAAEKLFLLSEDAALDPRARKRNMILNEIIKTERDYIRDLAVMREVYEFPIRHQKLLSDESIQPLFYNIEAILGFNKVLYEDLVTSAEKSNGDSVGSCFIKFADFLKMYAIYCSNHENAGKIYEKLLQTNAPFAEWVNQQRSTNALVKGAGLESYLIKPVQRLCRYPLLLKELLKETDPKHPDFAKISNALDKIQAVINKVNEFKRKFEGEVNVLEVQKRIVGCPPLVAPNRRLLKEGHLRALCGADEGKVKDSQVFMFNDLLVVARLKQRKGNTLSSMASSVSVDNLLATTGLGKAPAVPPKPTAAAKMAAGTGSTGFYYKFKDMMPLAVILLTDRKDGATKNAFEIFSKKLGGGQSKHVFFTFKKEDKDDWMKAILQQAADALNNEDEEEESESEKSMSKTEEWSEAKKQVLEAKPKEDIPAPWEKHCDPDGNVYYWNPDTDDSVWTIADIPRAHPMQAPVPPPK